MILSVNIYALDINKKEKDKIEGTPQIVNSVYTRGEENSYKYLYTYDYAGNIKKIVKEEYILLQTYPVRRTTYTYNAQNKPTMVLVEKVDKNHNWVNFILESYSYDVKGNLLSYVLSEWFNNTWVKSIERTYTYNDKGKKTSETEKNYENGKIDHGRKETYYYGDSDYLLEEYLYLWSDTKFTPHYRTVYKRLSNGILTEEIHYQYRRYGFPPREDWFEDFKREFKYNIQLLVSKQTTYKWKDNAWQYSDRLTYEYNKHGDMTKSLSEKYSNGNWIPVNRIIMEYNSKNLLIYGVTDIYDKKTSSWVHWMNGIMHYDKHDNLTEEIIQAWGKSGWVNYQKSSYNYNSWNNLEEMNFQNWDGNQWKNTDNTYLTFYDYKDREFTFDCYYLKVTYNEPSGVDDNKIQVSHLNVFPNPATDYITVTANSYNADISVSNMSGSNVNNNIKILKTGKMMRIDVSNLPNGVYSINIIDGGIMKHAFFVISR
jgi:hypothetical protein